MDPVASTNPDFVRTFSHIGDPVPVSDHGPFWKHWFDALVDHTPVLKRRETSDPSDLSATHEFDSAGGVTIGARLVLPGDGRPVRASLVTVHGDMPPDPLDVNARRWQRVADRGVAVLLMRLRGYPGSRTSCGDLVKLNEHGNTWITQGFDAESHDEWILPKGVADVCNACRVMRNALLHRNTDTDIAVDESVDHPGVYLHGSSLGGGLAVISAGQLIGKLRGESIIDRLAIAMPSLGDWATRLSAPSGAALQIRRVIDANPDRREELLDRLKLCDAIVHGRRVRVPTLAMLARVDAVVPPHCAAAVFNSIDADPGRKWRFLIDHGHHEGDAATNRRIALYRRALCDFFDPTLAPIRSIDPWECVMHEGHRPPAGIDFNDNE
ncbi:MAG: acetylxylan esterase [bacterium]|nr:acetylxylan esterase [bacterium]